jgi:hypothetical protein
MRYLDIAVAAMVGTAALAGLVAWAPGQSDLASRRLQARSALRDSLVAFIDEKGVAWFVSSPASEVCSGVSSASNSTYHIFAQVGAVGCGPPPPAGATAARVAFLVGALQVTLTAWSGAAA